MICFNHIRKYLVCVGVLSVVVFCSCSQGTESALHLQQAPLIALNSNAIKASIPVDYDSMYMFFSFPSEISQEGIASLAKDNSLSLRFSGAQEGTKVRIAFLYSEDFKSKHRLVKEMQPRSMVSGIIDAQNAAENFTIDMQLDENVRGFLVSSDGPIQIENASFQTIKYGWQKTSTGNWYGFSQKGGKIPNTVNDTSSQNMIFDFTGCDTTNKVYKVLLDDDNFGTVDAANRCILYFSSDEISIRHAPKQTSITLYPAIFKQADAAVSATKNGKMLSGLVLISDPNATYSNAKAELVPVVADPGIIVHWPQDTWRYDGYEVFQWEQFPDILVFDTKDYETQSKMFKRLAFYLEKTGYTGTLWPDEKIVDEHGYNAHDYQAKDLAAFFAQAELELFELNDRELQLKDILFQNSILKRDENKQIVAGMGAIASVSREIPPYLRVKLLTHEMLHGLYFTHTEYRKAVAKVFAATDPQSLQFLLRYWETNPSLGYDLNNTYLVQNEFMAYMAQQSVKSISNYFAENIANWKSTQKNIPELANYIKETNASGFVVASCAIQNYLFDTWGFASGRVSLVFLN